jgi:hypothetical protein
MWLMVPGGPRPTMVRGQSKGRHTVGPTTHTTIKNTPPKRLPMLALLCDSEDSMKRLMVPGVGHQTTSRGQWKEDLATKMTCHGEVVVPW